MNIPNRVNSTAEVLDHVEGVIKWLRTLHPEALVAFVTKYSDALAAGVLPPFTRDEEIAVIRLALIGMDVVSRLVLDEKAGESS